MDLVIYGMMRSGTTLLADRLTCRPHSLVLTEPNCHLNDWGKHTLEQLKAFGIEIDERLWDPAQWKDMEHFFCEHIQPRLAQIPFWGVKLAHFEGWARFLDTYRPTHLVLSVRDIRDVALSCLELERRRPPGKGHDHRWVEDRILHDAKELVEMSRREHIRVRYEDLCTDQALLPDLAEKLGLPKLGEAGFAIDFFPDRAYEKQRHGNAGVSSKSVQRYLTEGHGDDLAFAQRVWARCRDYCRQFEYEVAPRTLAWVPSFLRGRFLGKRRTNRTDEV